LSNEAFSANNVDMKCLQLPRNQLILFLLNVGLILVWLMISRYISNDIKDLIDNTPLNKGWDGPNRHYVFFKYITGGIPLISNLLLIFPVGLITSVLWSKSNKSILERKRNFLFLKIYLWIVSIFLFFLIFGGLYHPLMTSSLLVRCERWGGYHCLQETFDNTYNWTLVFLIIAWGGLTTKLSSFFRLDEPPITTSNNRDIKSRMDNSSDKNI
tara:strand:+ start:1390 stop:2028 length:639 start_codon:yes stop_codon:yes gene_type:complete